MPEPEDAITWQEAARILDRSLSTVARLVAAVELPKVRAGSTASSAAVRWSGSLWPAGMV